MDRGDSCWTMRIYVMLSNCVSEMVFRVNWMLGVLDYNLKVGGWGCEEGLVF